MEGFPTEIVVSRGWPEPVLPSRPGRERVAILTQPGAGAHAGELRGLIDASGCETELVGLPDRDESKTLDVARSVYETLARFGLGRHDTVVAVGGGSVTDLGGFVAGTWLRGVEVVHIPTTLLAAVDAAIGGKTGVNLGGKNLVGVIWHPTRVVVNTLVLESLPASLLREGFAEALKTGFVGDPHLVELLEAHGIRAPLDAVVSRALEVKRRIVAEDERELGVRAVLNFGHTFGHAIEFASTYSHGESVALGMVAASRISEARYRFAEGGRLMRAIDGLGLPLSVGGLDRARVRDLVRRDKKRDATGLRMVLLEAVGRPVLAHVSDRDIESGLTAIGL